MLAHLAVPVREQLERALALAFGRAVGRGLACEPQVAPHERQKPARRRADGIELRRDEALARMHLALAHQARQTLHALAVTPVVADVIGEGALDQLVVGVDDDPAGRVDEARVLVVGQAALPAVHRVPAGTRHPALGLMAGVAQRDRADRHQRHAILIGKRQVLRGRHEPLARRHRRRDRACAHQRHARAHRRVLSVERGPGQRHDMAGRRHGRQVEMPAGQHRAVLGPAQGDRHGLGVLHVDDRAARREIRPAVGGAIAFRIGGVQLFDVKVEIVDIGRGDAPAQTRIAPGEDQRDPGHGAADHATRLQFEPREIPEARRGEIEMRVVGQQRATRGRATGRRGEGVRGAGHPARREGHHRGRLGLGSLDQARHTREEARVIGQGGDAGARHVGHEVTHPVLTQKRDARAQHFLGDLGFQLHCQELQDRERIRRRPEGDRRIEEEELGRTTAAGALIDELDPLVDARRIGLERGARLLVLSGDRADRCAIKIEAAHQLVGFQRLGAEDFGEPPLHRAAQHRHLPKPVLRMGEAEREEHVAIRGAEDMRHVLGRANDLDGRRNPRDGVARIVIGQRTGREIPRAERHQHEAEQHRRDDPDHPLKQREHPALPSERPRRG